LGIQRLRFIEPTGLVSKQRASDIHGRNKKLQLLRRLRDDEKVHKKARGREDSSRGADGQQERGGWRFGLISDGVYGGIQAQQQFESFMNVFNASLYLLIKWYMGGWIIGEGSH
jgi:hypothetical protein